MKKTTVYPQGCTIPCNLCHSEDIDVLSFRDRRGQNLRTVICKHCGLIWTDPRPAASSIRDFYTIMYREKYKGACIPKPRHILRDTYEALRRYQFILSVLHSGDTLLDIGAGTGVFLYILDKMGYSHTLGIEPDRAYAHFAADCFDINIQNTFLQDFHTEQRFNIITLHHVLEHLEAPLETLKLIHGLLNDRGYLILEVPNALDQQQDPHNRYHVAHLYTFTPDTLEWMGRKAGFKACITKIAPHQGNITALYQKDCFAETRAMPENLKTNYTTITKTLNAHNSIHHFSSRVPYQKFLINAAKSVAEAIRVFRYENPKAIVDSVLKKNRY